MQLFSGTVVPAVDVIAVRPEVELATLEMFKELHT